MNDRSAVAIRRAQETDIERVVELLRLGTLRLDQENPDDLEPYARALTSNKVRADAHRFYERLGFTATHEGFKLALS